MQCLRRLSCTDFPSAPLQSRYLRVFAAASAPAAGVSGSDTSNTAGEQLSRWRLLRAQRRAAPPPKRRSEYQFDRKTTFPLATALEHVRASSWASFDETLELIFRLNIDPRKAEQNIRGLITLPHGTGSSRQVAVFAYPGAATEQAEAAGADLVGAEELTLKILETKGKILKGYAGSVATPELMSVISAKVGRILGPKGLMPNPKYGTVTGTAVGDAVERLKRGCTFRTDRCGNVHLRAGKLSFADEHLIENCVALTRGIIGVRPETVKKKYILSVYVCSSMGPSVRVDVEDMTRRALETVFLEDRSATDAQ